MSKLQRLRYRSRVDTIRCPTGRYVFNKTGLHYRWSPRGVKSLTVTMFSASTLRAMLKWDWEIIDPLSPLEQLAKVMV
jgi:hypothetical protein